jgi:DNA polymerase III subunit delta'
MCTEGTGCGDCRHCTLVARQAHSDLKLLQLPADRRNIPIKDVHEFMLGIALKPLEAPRKVYIVDQADMLQEDGANALLKTLEEPPAAVTLILTATDPARLLPTIVSRCQRIALRPVATRDISSHLQDELGLPEDRAESLARASHGMPGWAILAATTPELADTREARASDLLRLLRSSRLDRLKYADELAERWSGHNEEVIGTLEIWVDTWRDLARAAAGLGPSLTREALDSGSAAGANVDVATARGGVRATLDAVEALRANAHPRLTLENLLLFWPALPFLNRG